MRDDPMPEHIHDPSAGAASSTPPSAHATEPEPVAPSASAPPTASPASEGLVSPDQVKLALRKVKDPELNLNIVDLGLVYDIRVDGPAVTVDMSLTTPACPSGPQIVGDTEAAVRALPGVERATVNIVWSPMWSPERIEPRIRAYLGM